MWINNNNNNNNLCNSNSNILHCISIGSCLFFYFSISLFKKAYLSSKPNFADDMENGELVCISTGVCLHVHNIYVHVHNVYIHVHFHNMYVHVHVHNMYVHVHNIYVHVHM